MDKKKHILITSFLILLLLSLLIPILLHSNKNITDYNTNISEMKIVSSRGSQIIGDLKNEVPIIVSYVTSDCISCQQTIKRLTDTKVRDHKILILSSESNEVLTAKLPFRSNITYAHVDGSEFYKYIGTLATPTTFLLDNHRVIKFFNQVPTLDKL